MLPLLLLLLLLLTPVPHTEMISDATVGDLLLEQLLQPASTGSSTAELNCVVDGFPRTAVQVRAGTARGCVQQARYLRAVQHGCRV
jgi:hypothetical protein